MTIKCYFDPMAIPVAILQAPLVQLNAPYPSGAYLSAFFRGLASGRWPVPGGDKEVTGGGEVPGEVLWVDGSERLFSALFSRAGLARLFDLSTETALGRAERAEREGDPETAFQLRRFVSLSDSWSFWIDDMVSILRGGDRELCHGLARSPHAPRGARMEAWLASLADEGGAGGAEVGPDDARTLATLALEDLADYIAAAYDGEFSLVRYAESIAASEGNFSRIEAALDRPLLRDFFVPLCEGLWDEISLRFSLGEGDSRFLLCLSVPFPGTLAPALAAAKSAKRRFGSRVTVALGGGYVSTELRSYAGEALFDYIDQLSFDRGYGGYAAWFRSRCPSGEGAPRRVHCPEDLRGFEEEVTRTVVPDYSDIDFSRYPRLADTPNPMHRLWSDGAWMKAMLAHGCYWHRCSFCDVTLDYIRGYRPVDVAALHAGLMAQAGRAGVRGVHFVDEAAPPRSLRDFAELNLRSRAEGKRPLSFWGNIRFEGTFNRDLADYLSFGGLTAVSGGIEIASEEGFKAVDKGIDLENLVGTCAAFKEAGVLVHAYLIYGYWNEDAQGVIDAAETMRQLFAAGLVDSAFWHKFVLTRHSRAFNEWKRGMHRGGSNPLVPLTREGLPLDSGEPVGVIFAENDLAFRGEESSSRYTAPLDAALQAWMHGEGLSRSVRKWFPFPMPPPRVAPDAIDSLIAAYERRRDAERSAPYDPKARYAWTGSRPVSAGPKGEYLWLHLGEEIRRSLPESLVLSLVPGAGSAGSIAGAGYVGSRAEALAHALSGLSKKDFSFLRSSGLVKISPLA